MSLLTSEHKLNRNILLSRLGRNGQTATIHNGPTALSRIRKQSIDAVERCRPTGCGWTMRGGRPTGYKIGNLSLGHRWWSLAIRRNITHTFAPCSQEMYGRPSTNTSIIFDAMWYKQCLPSVEIPSDSAELVVVIIKLEKNCRNGFRPCKYKKKMKKQWNYKICHSLIFSNSSERIATTPIGCSF